MPEQTVFKAGNSNVISIPKDLSDEWKLKSGEKVIVEERGDELVIRKASKKSTTKKLVPGEEFKKWWNEFVEENGEILDELALR